MTTMIKKIVRLSPVPVVFRESIHTLRGFVDGWVTMGRYCPKNGSFKECIEVVKNIPHRKKIGILLHEIGHAICAKRGCRCATKVSWEGEHHADMYALKWLLDHKKRKPLISRMQAIKDHSSEDNLYAVAAAATMSSDLWQDCEDWVAAFCIVRRIGRWITNRMRWVWL